MRGTHRVALLTAAVVVGVLVAPTANATLATAKSPKPTPGTVALSDSFDAGAPDWTILNQTQAGSFARSGAVVVEVRSSGEGDRVYHKAITTPPSYALEVDTVLTAGDRANSYFGVICRANFDEQYELLINASGNFGIYRTTAAKGTERLDSKTKASKRAAAKAIKRGLGADNRVRGECLPGGKLRLFVNGKFVSQATDPTPLANQNLWGLYVAADKISKTSSVTFDNFKLFALKS